MNIDLLNKNKLFREAYKNFRQTSERHDYISAKKYKEEADRLYKEIEEIEKSIINRKKGEQGDLF